MERPPWELLQKHFGHRITDEEQLSLDLWINESKEHQLLFEEISNDIRAGLPFPWNFREDTFALWQKLMGKNLNTKTLTISLRKLYRVAAAIAIPLMLAGVLTGYLLSNGSLPKMKSDIYTEVYSSGGQKTKVTLPDGSQVWLNSNTTLRYPTLFDSKERNVYIDGEGFFDVTHKSNQPFIVSTSSQLKIRVFGTSFNVMAYKDENVVEATLVNGKISIEGVQTKGKKTKTFFMEPNETFRYIKKNVKDSGEEEQLGETKSVSKKQIEPAIVLNKHVDVSPILAWRDGKLIFNNESFESLSTRLERWYNVKIYFDDRDVKRIKFTGVFEKENINQVLNYLKILTPFEYEMRLNEIHIHTNKNPKQHKEDPMK